jgi:hypothetical protein
MKRDRPKSEMTICTAEVSAIRGYAAASTHVRRLAGVAQQDVLGLEVAVDDVVGVQVRHALEYLPYNVPCVELVVVHLLDLEGGAVSAASGGRPCSTHQPVEELAAAAEIRHDEDSLRRPRQCRTCRSLATSRTSFVS